MSISSANLSVKFLADHAAMTPSDPRYSPWRAPGPAVESLLQPAVTDAKYTKRLAGAIRSARCGVERITTLVGLQTLPEQPTAFELECLAYALGVPAGYLAFGFPEVPCILPLPRSMDDEQRLYVQADA